jgi:hypothetical protein
MSTTCQRSEPVGHPILDGRSIVLFEYPLVRLSPLGTRIVRTPDTPPTIENLPEARRTRSGAPTQGGAVAATRDPVTRLVTRSVPLEAGP